MLWLSPVTLLWFNWVTRWRAPGLFHRHFCSWQKWLLSLLTVGRQTPAISLAITFQWTLPCNRILAQQVPSQLGKLLERRQGRHSHFLIPSLFFCYCLWFNDAIERTFCYSLKPSTKLDFKCFSFCPNYPFCLLLLYVPLAGHWPFSQISCNWFIWHRDKMTHTALIAILSPPLLTVEHELQHWAYSDSVSMCLPYKVIPSTGIPLLQESGISLRSGLN